MTRTRASWRESEKEEEGDEERERERGSGKVKRRRGLQETDSVGDRGRTIWAEGRGEERVQNDGEGWDLDAHGD